jgi:hypothetical protein
MVIKDKNKDITINCPFNIGDVVTITDFSYAYFGWWVEKTPRLQELCPEQYGEGDPIFYDTNDVPKEWKVKHVISHRLDSYASIDVVLISRFRQTIAMQVHLVLLALDTYWVDETRIPFKVIKSKRKTIDYLEI